MKITIDLLKLIGAEPIEHNRVPGVFIPFIPNANVQYGKRGMCAFVSFFLAHNKKLKNFDMVGSVIIPEEHKDKYLENDTLVRKYKNIAWGWNGRTKKTESSSIVTKDDFESLISD